MRGIIRSTLAGAVGGAVGTLFMDLLWYRRYRDSGGDQPFAPWETSAGTTGFEDAAAPARTAKAMAELFGVELPDSSARALNNGVHWITGIAWGKAHGVVAGTANGASPFTGLVTGVVAWATSYVVLPKLGVYEEMSEYEPEVLWQDLSAHLVYGSVLGTVYWALSRRPAGT
ncbi:MAG: hypothetical protein WAL25_01525 [Acidimicrobiia bacterium]